MSILVKSRTLQTPFWKRLHRQLMVNSPDEYDAFDFSEFTEDDLRKIDAELARKLAGRPQLPIQLESTSDFTAPAYNTDRTKRQSPSNLSPFQEYRRNGTFSVTDLVSLAWCELQFDYGLRQKRSRPLASRPASFISAQGKKIFVQKAVAALNDETTKKGKAVHKELEREIRPEEIQVDITSQEERWALRLVSMLAGLNSVIYEGITREMPIFGMVHDDVIVGIIDEIILRRPVIPDALSNSDEETSETSSTRPPKAPKPENVEQPPTTPFRSPPPIAAGQNALRVIDTKTRRTDSLPPHEDTLPSRVQLTLYRRLLCNLISTSSPFDFPSLWKRLRLNPLARLSDRFLIQTGLVSDAQKIYCLNDLSASWIGMISQPDFPVVHPTLEIIYRLQPQGMKWMRRKRRTPLPVEIKLVVNQEDLDLAKAIEASLDDLARHEKQGETPDAAPDRDEPSTSLSAPVNDLPPLPTSGDPSLFPNGRSEIATSPSLDDDDRKIIGTKEFQSDDVFLDEYLTTALEWWHGRRNPRGVSLENARRCFTCEYAVGCEWREQKASEFKDQLEAQRRDERQ